MKWETDEISALKMVSRWDLFTTEECVQHTGVDAFTLRNWIKRKVAPVGKLHKSGRWMFSVVDLIRVSSMVDTASNIGVEPSIAVGLSDQVVALLDTHIDLSLDRRAVALEGSALAMPLDCMVIIAFIDKGKVSWRNAVRVGGQYKFGDAEAQAAGETMMKVSHVVLAAGLIVDDIMEKVRDIVHPQCAATARLLATKLDAATSDAALVRRLADSVVPPARRKPKKRK